MTTVRQAYHDIRAISTLLPDGILPLTDSAYGCLGELLHDPAGAAYLKPHALTKVVWGEAAHG